MPKSKEATITDHLYEAVRACTGSPPGDKHWYPAVQRRVKDILLAVKDAAEVEVVALTLVELDCESFSAGWSLNWGSYDRVKRELAWPDGSWEYVLWSRSLASGALKQSVDYWLGVWQDADLECDERAVWDAGKFLKQLKELNTEIST